MGVFGGGLGDCVYALCFLGDGLRDEVALLGVEPPDPRYFRHCRCGALRTYQVGFLLHVVNEDDAGSDAKTSQNKKPPQNVFLFFNGKAFITLRCATRPKKEAEGTLCKRKRGASTTWDPGGGAGQVQRLLIRVRGVKLV